LKSVFCTRVVAAVDGGIKGSGGDDNAVVNPANGVVNANFQFLPEDVASRIFSSGQCICRLRGESDAGLIRQGEATLVIGLGFGLADGYVCSLDDLPPFIEDVP